MKRLINLAINCQLSTVNCQLSTVCVRVGFIQGDRSIWYSLRCKGDRLPRSNRRYCDGSSDTQINNF
ncbi:MAG: hypothetical protein HC942_28810 [Microcoleus sp. SU_5_6]|nr:hypothetical protein [Microcoleus sp. SU_5_6]